MRLVFTRQAQVDLDSIWDWIAKDSLNAADRVVDEVKSCCNLLTIHPHLGELCPQYGKQLRRLSSGRYLIFYRIFPSRISIYRILHGARDLDSLF